MDELGLAGVAEPVRDPVRRFTLNGAPEAVLLWKLSGSYLMVILEETEGPLEIDLVGGRLQAQGVRGDGKTTLKLSDGAEALLVEVGEERDARQLLAVGLYAEGAADRIAAVTTEGVGERARNVIDPSRLTWVVVGDLAKIEDSVRSLEYGPVEVWDGFGNPVR